VPIDGRTAASDADAVFDGPNRPDAPRVGQGRSAGCRGRLATGFLDKAKDAADRAAERARTAAEHASEIASVGADRATTQVRVTKIQAGGQFKVAAGQARVGAGQFGKATSEAVGTAATAVSDPANQARAKMTARAGLTKARSGLSGMIDRIDPGLMADLVIKSTTLQEKANRSLREKGSPYRINEITITAGIPPDVAFTIGRIDVMEEIKPSRVVDDELESGSGAQAEPDQVPALGSQLEPSITSDAETELDEAVESGDEPDLEPDALGGHGVLLDAVRGIDGADPIPELVARP
jgi:hypothetical protein